MRSDSLVYVSTRIQGSLAVMAVTLPCDGDYSSPSPSSAYFESRGRCKMQKDERDLLEVLKFELQFLEDGSYGRSPRTPWRPQYIFEDSLTCMNYDSKENPGPCGDCVLMQLVPPERRSERFPAATFRSTHRGRLWIPSTGTATNKRPKKRLEPG